MSGHVSARLSQWWVHGVDAEDRGAGSSAPAPRPAWTSRIAAGLRRRLLRASRNDEPRNADELRAMARRLEGEMPNLAAELRMIAMHRPDAHG